MADQFVWQAQDVDITYVCRYYLLAIGEADVYGFHCHTNVVGGGTSHYENRCGASVGQRICWHNSHRVCVVFDCTGTIGGNNRDIVVIFGTVCRSKAKLIWGGVR